MALKVSREKIEELVSDLQEKSTFIETAEDLEGMLGLIEQLKSLVDMLVAELRKTFESDEWRTRPTRRPNSRTSSVRAPSFSEGVFAAAERVTARLENALKSSQRLSVELDEVSTALRVLLPVYRLGMEIFEDLQDIDQAIKTACEGLGSLFDGSFEES